MNLAIVVGFVHQVCPSPRFGTFREPYSGSVYLQWVFVLYSLPVHFLFIYWHVRIIVDYLGMRCVVDCFWRGMCSASCAILTENFSQGSRAHQSAFLTAFLADRG